VTFAVAARGTIGREVRTVGQVAFDETRVRTIAARVDGWVETLFVNQTGQFVAEGQRLLTIYSPMLVSAQEELLLAKRLDSTVTGGTATARRDAAELLESSRRRLAQWDVSDSVIQLLEATGRVQRSVTLRSTVRGHVLEKNVLAGQRVMAGDPLYKVADLSTVWIEGDVFEQDLSTVRVGQVVQVSLDALAARERSGRIAYVYPTINPETRTARIRVVLDNRDAMLKPGMYATLIISGTAGRETIVVPRSAVLTTGERSIVFVRDAQGRLVPREVMVGGASGDRIEIIRGLAAGESVVASATFLVDAESNLGTALGGMGDMPGMDITRPPKPLGAAKER
jgi:Cu(I)/Ag(I) efflux system membrane fusion protein